MASQSVRRSQYIYTYGPGAILEGAFGPRLIPRPDIGLFDPKSLSPEIFEISDQRMSEGLLNNARIFQLPSNAALGEPDTRYVYRTKPFPSWKLCLNYDRHNPKTGVLYSGQKCPGCGDEKGRQEIIRFVRACPNGHLDDVDWWHLIHHRSSKSCSRGGHYLWHGSGSSLSQIEIECPRCRMKQNLGRVYGQPWPCSGRYPENEPLEGQPSRGQCSEKSYIIQRQASNLRLVELRTLFTIPPRATRLHSLLQNPSVLGALGGRKPSLNQLTEDDVKDALSNLGKNSPHLGGLIEELLGYPADAILSAIRDVSGKVTADYSKLLSEEFQALRRAAEEGFPPVRGKPPQSPVLFEVKPNRVKSVHARRGVELRIVPVERLRTITVQIGYRREVGGVQEGSAISRLVKSSFTDTHGQEWYPGVELFGEGIFIFMDKPCAPSGSAAEEWRKAWEQSGDYPDELFRGTRAVWTGSPSPRASQVHAPQVKEELHPMFVWWHTLAHLVIRTISIHAGYSSASIRERVYVDIKDDGSATGGIALYATQPGSDGTLGGLTGLVPYFEEILRQVREMAVSCSNDPLCGESHFRKGDYAGAVCYGCTLVSETSCEHRNLWLDRRVLVENLP